MAIDPKVLETAFKTSVESKGLAPIAEGNVPVSDQFVDAAQQITAQLSENVGLAL